MNKVALGLILLSCILWSCAPKHNPQSTGMEKTKSEQSIPANSEEKAPHFRGLYDRIGDKIVDAPEADIALAKTYFAFKNKGPIKNGKQITILSHSNEVKAGSEIRILHFYEVTDSSSELFIMGPKTVYGEYINGEQQGPNPPTEAYPWMMVYDGAVLPGPDVDYNFEISKYTFDEPGEYRFQWKIEGLESNEIVVLVK